MNQDEVMQVIGAMSDYADKQNNSGMKNIVLAALIGILATAALGVIGYLTKELYNLRQEKEALRAQVLRLEMRHEAAIEEQNKVMFEMLEGMDRFAERIPFPPQPDDDEPIVKLPDPERTKKFNEYHKMFEQRVKMRMPPEQRMAPSQPREEK